MNYLVLFFCIFIFSTEVFSKRLCETIEAMKCPDSFNGRRTTGASLPTRASGATSNPAGISTDKGFGIESINYEDSYAVSLFSGTGVVGSGLATSNNEGTFFGNIPYESQEEYEVRRRRTDKFKSEKYVFITAVSLLGKKKKRTRFTMNLGIIAKYNTQAKRFDGGVGLALSFFGLSIGFTRLSDHGLRSETDALTLVKVKQKEKYYTNIYTGGLKVLNFAIDYTYIANKSATPTKVHLTTGSLFFRSLMLTYGLRNENHGHYTILGPTTVDINSTTSRSSFYGVQYNLKKRFLFGLFYNYYTNHDLSFGLNISI